MGTIKIKNRLKHYLIQGFFVLILSALYTACDDDVVVLSEEERAALDDVNIINFLKSHYFDSKTEQVIDTADATFDKTFFELVTKDDATGIYYYIFQEGEGTNPEVSEQVLVHYQGFRLADGGVFDSSLADGFPRSFTIEGTIPGWQFFIPKLKTGQKNSENLYEKTSKGYVFIPSQQAYGARALSGIPQHSVLVFYVELLDIVE